MTKIDRHFITLLELLVVMSLIALISGVAAIGIDKALVNQRFKNEVGLIVDDFRLAQELMMVLGADVHVKFAEFDENKGIEYWLEMDTKIDKNLEHLLMKRKRVLKTIRGVFFEGNVNDQQTHGVLDFKFFSHGSVMSKALIRLSISGSENPPKDTLESFICLAGYPKSIISEDLRGTAELSCNQGLKDEQFNETVTQDTLSRLPESLLKSSAAPKVEENKDEEKKDDGKKPNEKKTDNLTTSSSPPNRKVNKKSVVK